MEKPTAIIEGINNWMKRSVTLKLVMILILMLILLIPSTMIDSIIMEREGLSRETISEVSSKWADRQYLAGPVLTVPLEYQRLNGEQLETYTRQLHVLPHQLNITGQVTPQKLKRGIYEVVVYTTDLNVTGSFNELHIPDSTDLKRVRLDQAFLTLGISDLRGIEKEIIFNWDNQVLPVEPGSKLPDVASTGVTMPFGKVGFVSDKKHSFNCDLRLQGSHNLSFLPLGNTTDVKITSEWPAPSFNGGFIPDKRNVSEKGFSAEWNILQLNRNMPPQWTGSLNNDRLYATAFGMDLLLPVDDYQKAMRSSKYAIMTIALTFLIFFLVELLNKRQIHPFQYTLVGLALCLFYILLIAISEHSNFNFAYTVSTVVVVSMISLYSLSVFKAPKITFGLGIVLIGIYGFLFTILQVSDYALLMGSVGLTVILAATMYFTRRVNWYKLGSGIEVEE